MTRHLPRILLIAFLLRFLYVFLLIPFLSPFAGDGEFYRYLDGDGYMVHAAGYHAGEFFTTDEFLRRMPLYPALISFWTNFPGGWLSSEGQIRLIQFWHILLDLITTACVYLVVHRVIHARAAFWSGLGYAVYPLAVYRLVMMGTEVIQGTALALFIVGAVHFLQRPNLKSALCLSILSTLILLITPAFQFYPLFLARLFLFHSRTQAFRLAAVYLLPILLILLLWGRIT